MLDSIRNAIPAQSRATFYAVASALVAALVAWGALEDAAAPAVTGVAIATVTLVFALIHSDSSWRQSLYGLAAAVGVLGAYLGWGTEDQFGALLSVLAPVLGIGTAAAYTHPEHEMV